MTLYLNNAKRRIILKGKSYSVYFTPKSTNVSPDIDRKLISLDGSILKDINSVYLVYKED